MTLTTYVSGALSGRRRVRGHHPPNPNPTRAA